MLPSLSELELSRLRRKPLPSRVKEYFSRAATAAVVSKAYENLNQPIESEFYRNEAIYFLAKGLESLAFESSKS